MPDKYITLQIPSEFFVKFTEKSACFKIWGRRPFNAPFSMMEGFVSLDNNNTDLLELTSNEHGECYEFALKEWLIDQEDNRTKLAKFFVEPPEPELPLFDKITIESPFNKTKVSSWDAASSGHNVQLEANEEDEDWKRLEEIGESLEESIFVESKYEQ
jgi:hypothetical protein